MYEDEGLFCNSGKSLDKVKIAGTEKNNTGPKQGAAGRSPRASARHCGEEEAGRGMGLGSWTGPRAHVAGDEGVVCARTQARDGEAAPVANSGGRPAKLRRRRDGEEVGNG